MNLVGAAGLISWGALLVLTLLGVLESSVWRLAIDVAGLAVAIGVIASLRGGASVDVVAQVAHAFLFVSLLGLAIVMADNPLMMALPLVYPAMAFLLLDDMRRGIAGTLLMTAALNIALASGLGPELAESGMLLDGALTVIAGMGFQAVVVALYVHHRNQVMERLRSVSEQLAELASHDPLTGVLNRRTFSEVLERELSRHDREERELAFLLFDVDNFKAYNDRFGHPRGDELLKRFAETVRAVFSRGEDIVFRLGGEEFAVVFHTEDATQAAEMADRLLAAVEAMGEPAPAGPRRTVTVSAGLCLVPHGSDVAANAIYSRADEALYRAKQGGRARWVHASG